MLLTKVENEIATLDYEDALEHVDKTLKSHPEVTETLEKGVQPYANFILLLGLKSDLLFLLGRIESIKATLDHYTLEVRQSDMEPKVRGLLLAHLLLLQISVYNFRGDLKSQDNIISEIESLISELDTEQDLSPRLNRRILASYYNLLAINQWNKSRIDAAEVAFQKAATLFKQLELELYHATIIFNLGLISHSRGSAKDAIKYFESGRSTFEKYKQNFLLASVDNNIGVIYEELGELSKSLRYHKESLRRRKLIGNQDAIAESYINLGTVLQRTGNLDEAINYLMDARSYFGDIGNSRHHAIVEQALGEIKLARGQLEEAREHFNEGLNLLQESENKFSMAFNYTSLGRIHRQMGEFGPALKFLEKALEMREELGNMQFIAITQCEIAETMLLMGDRQGFDSYLQRIAAIEEESGNRGLMLRKMYLEGLGHKMGKRAKDKVLAEQVFKEILDHEDLEMEVKVQATRNLLDILLEELEQFGQNEVINELQAYLNDLEDLTSSQGLTVSLIEVKLIQHKLHLLLANSVESTEHLNMALKLAEKIAIPTVSQKVDGIKRKFDYNYDVWKNLDQLEMSLSDRLKLNLVSNSLRDSHSLLRIYQKESSRPILLLLIAEAGTIVFSVKFESYDAKVVEAINPHLLASFLSALNSFGRDTFQTKEVLETLTYGNHKVVSRKMGVMIISFMYEGTTFDVYRNMEKVEIYLKESGIYDHILNTPNREIRLKDEQINFLKGLFE